MSPRTTVAVVGVLIAALSILFTIHCERRNGAKADVELVESHTFEADPVNVFEDRSRHVVCYTVMGTGSGISCVKLAL
jgi:hypothetical protein